MQGETAEHPMRKDSTSPMHDGDRAGAPVRFIRLLDDGGEEVRSAALLRVALFIGLAFAVVVPVVGIISTGGLASNAMSGAAVALTVVNLGWHTFCMVLNKRGAFRFVVVAYGVVVHILIALAVMVTGGASSYFWVAYLWPIVVSAVFLPKHAMPGHVVVVVAQWLSVFLLERLGVFQPALWQVMETQAQHTPIMALVMAVMCGALLGPAFRALFSAQAALERVTIAHKGHQDTLALQLKASSAEAQRRLLQVSLMQDLNRIIVSASDVNDLLQRAGRLLSDGLGAYHVLVFLTDETGEWLVQEMTVQEFPSLIQLRVGEEGIVGHAAATGRSYITFDVTSDRYYKAFPGLSSSVSAAAIPIVVQGQTLGVLALESEDRDTFSEQTVEILETVANVLGVAVMSARTLKERRDLLERLRRYEVQEFASEWRQVLERRQGRVAMLYDRMAVRPVGVAEGEALFSGADSERIEAVERADGTHVLMVPLKVGDQALGRLMFESDIPWQDDQRTLVEAVTAQMGLALENARLLEDTRLSALRERARSEIVGRVRSSVQIDAVLRSAVEELGRALQVERARIQLVLPGHSAREHSGG